MIKDLIKRLGKLEMTVQITDEAKEYIADKGYDPQFGARPLKRAIQKLIEDKISEELLKGTIHSGSDVEIDFKNEELVVNKK